MGFVAKAFTSTASVMVYGRGAMAVVFGPVVGVTPKPVLNPPPPKLLPKLVVAAGAPAPRSFAPCFRENFGRMSDPIDETKSSSVSPAMPVEWLFVRRGFGICEWRDR
ncbi:hypothetical protein BLNAU_680 [Blattamonas nauphoetae]|uniref:Uncharacterized protein n=1 Tax=Blattamonas nauphoetae TaxID=2049346 RepID=A0ABQ9YK75_9EUKA|nr:hypothetical protein BLNAU_680 [Blattamonas nauphoetae]